MSKGSINIVFAIKGMNYPGGGAERILAEVAGELVTRGHQVTLLTWDQPDGESYYKLNPDIVRIDLGLGLTSESATPIITFRRILAMRPKLRALSPDVVICFLNSMFIPVSLALLFTGIPQIASEHIVYSHYRDKHLQRFLLGLTPLLTKRITCVSQQALDTYPTHMRKHMVVVNNPITLEIRSKADVEAAVVKPKTLLAVGRLNPQKDHATLIKAFALISEEVPDWQVRIVGEGELHADLAAQINSLTLQDRIHLVGAVKDISTEYATAQLFVMPSRYESLGLTTIEAQAHGLPTVGFSDCPGTNELIQDGINGILVPTKNNRVESLAVVLKKLMLDDYARMDLAAKMKEVPSRYQLKHIVDQWEAIIQEIIADKNG